MAEAVADYKGPPLPVGTKGERSSGWWGVLAVILTEAALFAYLLFSYFYIGSQVQGQWPPDGKPKLLIAVVNTVLLLSASGTMWWAERGIERDNNRQMLLGTAATIALGLVFLGLQAKEWMDKPFTVRTHVYGSLFFTVEGFHMAHVVIGLLTLALLLIWAARGLFDARRHAVVSIGVLYWHFVTAVWIAVFSTFYVSPYLSS